MSRVQRNAIWAGGGLSLVLATVFVVANAPPPDQSPRAVMWKKVDDSVGKGLPQSAIKELEPIIEAALKEKAYPEAIKAVAKKIALEGNIQGNKPEERITRMKAEIAKAPKEMVPAMDALLAHWYWHYFQHNRWRFLQRTATSAPPGADFTTWDLPRLFAEIDAQYTKALSAEKELKAIPVAAFDALLVKGTIPDIHRPTLYDFLAHEALQFYTSGEQAAAQRQDAFEVSAADPILGSVEDFLKWKPETDDSGSLKLKAIRLYQNLLTFHAADKDPTARLDADLDRLRFGYNVAFGDEKAARYKAALERFATTHADHETSAMARARWAELERGENDHVEARQIALQAVNAFPASQGGIQCFNLVRQIEAKEVHVTVERVWADPLAPVRVKYRNVTKVHFRAVKADWVANAGQIGQGRWRPEQLIDADRQMLLGRPPAAAWAADLPATPDYHENSVDIAPPKGLAPGFYYLIASPAADFGERDNVLYVSDFWVSDLAVVIRSMYGHGKLEGLVLNSKSGEPIPNATVHSWVRNNQNNRADVGPTTKTDANGLFNFAAGSGNNWILLAESNGHLLGSMNDHYFYTGGDRYQTTTQSVLFTDRSLYRPGQSIHFKGIALVADTKADSYKVLPNESLSVVFLDPNQKEITRLAVRSNDYGSFHGTFTAPRDRLTGRMFIRVEGSARGQARVSVEEYKRPKFQVTLDPPAESPKLDAAVKLSGKAVGYTGAAVGGAKVTYRVTREVRWPTWYYGFYWWRMPPNPGAAQEIAHGTTTTAADGTFGISFTAEPDRSVSEKDEPTFRYAVHADVTDTTGETRSDHRSVNVGYTALQAGLTLDEWQTTAKDVKLTVSTSTLDGDGAAAKGTVKIYKLKSPETVVRPELHERFQPGNRRRGKVAIPVPKPKADPSDPRTWELGEVVATLDFATDATGKKELTAKLPAGLYRAVAETADRFGKPVTAHEQIRVLNPEEATLPLKVPHLFAAEKWTLEPGQEFVAVWGTGYDRGRAFVEIEHRGAVIHGYWTDVGKTQVSVKQPVTEAMRGGFTVRVTYVRENRAYLETRKVEVPWTNKELTVKWERFVSKLEPAKKETFTAVVSGPNAAKAVAEMVAALYDASLDAYQPHHWLHRFNVFRQDYSGLSSHFENVIKGLDHYRGQWAVAYRAGQFTYRSFPADLTQNMWGYDYRFRGAAKGGAPGAPAPMSAAQAEGGTMLGRLADGKADNLGLAAGEKLQAAPPADSGPDLSKVSARKNLNETAFFFPQLTAGADGSVRLVFTMPEALTKWKFIGFAHDRDLRSGYLDGEVVTAKDLMVQPNPPRFLREGDVIEFSVKVSNQSATRQSGKAKFTAADARTTKPVDEALGNTSGEQPFDLPPGESKTLFWKLTVPDGLGPITYTAVAATDRLSDGEEGMLPVLSKRVLVAESMPLPIRNAGSKTFDFAKLKASGRSDTLKHQSLTVQVVSQPAWYAVLALPYLMEYPHECSEQIFNRMYANALARHVAQSDPKIRRVFDQWRNTPALDSPLQKNQDLKAVMLEETPWLRDAEKESEQRRNVGILFDDNRLAQEIGANLRKLSEMQRENGMWPWFPGGPDNEYLSLYITTGFGRLRHLGVKVDPTVAVKAVTRLDAWMAERHAWILAHSKNPEDNHLSPTVALYLYGRSFFLADKAVGKEHTAALDYWKRQAKNHWLKLGNRQSQAHIALGLKRFGDRDTAVGIVASLKERSVSNEEMGRYWRDTELSYWWYHAPVESQAVMIEAFDEIVNDAAAVEDCKAWLLKQKQTQNWKTTKATADAVYALLLRGTNLLSSDALVEVKLGDQVIKPESVEAGTGFYEEKFVRGEVKPEFGTVTLKKTDAGVSWASVHWQYLEDVSKVTPHDGTPLKLEKSLFKRTLTKAGPVLEAVNGPVAVGDEVVCRVILRTDRDMEYVHLKDHRGSGTEPVNVLSRYKFQDGLSYYESTKDTSSHFFIDYLPKGVYVFEYAVRVQHKGRYPSGLASVQCMYAPEFNSHSASVMMDVK